MDQAIAAVLAEYDSRAAREEQRMRDRAAGGSLNLDEMLLRVGPQSATLLNLLAKEAGARAILEIGTSYGYSTIWLAEAARATGGRVITLEIHPGKVEYARERLSRAGLAAYAEFCLGDAQTSLKSLAGPFDFVLLDLWKDLYIACFDLMLPKLADGAIVVADNMLYPDSTRPDAARYRRHVRSIPGVSSVLLPVGSGLEVTRLRADP